MKPVLLISIIVLLLAASAQPKTKTGSLPQHVEDRERRFDGKWWVLADSEEQDGFLNGSADCLVWVAQKKWISHSVAWVKPKITEYYQTIKTSNAEPVVDVWQRVLSKAPPDIASPAAEKWTSPHGYFDGGYWREGSNSEHVGFLEGYLACLRTQVPSPPQTYSHSIAYYVDRIDKYVADNKAHPNSVHESIANILAHFRDRPTNSHGSPR